VWDQAIGDHGWINIFLDNHDFPRLVSRWGNDKKYRKEAAKLLATLILTMRGTPCIYQGSEIGMTNVAFNTLEDYRDVETINFAAEHKAKGGDMDEFLKAVHQQGRDNVRTPFHWDDSKQGGFTNGTPWIKINPNYTTINAKEAIEDEHSVFYYYQRMLKFRKQFISVLTHGSYKELLPEHQQLFVYERRTDDELFLIVLNMSDDEVKWLPDFWGSTGSPNDMTLAISNLLVNDEQVLKPWEARIYMKMLTL
jgi:oligo-1,6-glucosidase